MSQKSIRFYFEEMLLRFGLLVIPRLPRRVVLFLARVFSRLAFHGARHLRNVGLANLDIAFGDNISVTRKREILRKAFGSFALMLLDDLWFSKDTEARISRLVTYDPAVRDHLRHEAMICISAHMGNWEVLGMAITMLGHPLVSVATPIENPGIDKLLNRIRHLTGQQVFPKQGVVRHLLRTLKDQGKVALLLDQNTKPTDGGIFVDFFGLPVPVSSAAASLALRTQAAIFIGVCLPLPNGTYFVPAPISISASHGTDTASPETQIQNLTMDISRGIEQMVKTHPEHWLWMYKRWKYVAPGRRQDEYPFYAKQLSQKDAVKAA